MNCPICQKPAITRYQPFCSKHCANIDLYRWLNEDYRIPAQSDQSAKQEEHDYEDSKSND